MSILNKSFTLAHSRLSMGKPPRWPIDQQTTPGCCRNLDYCSIGMQRVLIQVPLVGAFVCPECAGPLSAPLRRFRLTPTVLPALRVAVLLTGMSAAFCIGYSTARVQPMVGRAVEAASRTAMQAADAMVRPPPPPTVLPGRIIQVAERPYPAKTVPVDLTSPPMRLLHEARFGQVTVDCTLAARAPRPVCHVADLRGADAFSDAPAWLQSRAVHYIPTAHSGEAAPPDHRWRVVFEDFGGTQRRDAQ